MIQIKFQILENFVTSRKVAWDPPEIKLHLFKIWFRIISRTLVWPDFEDLDQFKYCCSRLFSIIKEVIESLMAWIVIWVNFIYHIFKHIEWFLFWHDGFECQVIAMAEIIYKWNVVIIHRLTFTCHSDELWDSFPIFETRFLPFLYLNQAWLYKRNIQITSSLTLYKMIITRCTIRDKSCCSPLHCI